MEESYLDLSMYINIITLGAEIVKVQINKYNRAIVCGN